MDEAWIADWRKAADSWERRLEDKLARAEEISGRLEKCNAELLRQYRAINAKRLRENDNE